MQASDWGNTVWVVTLWNGLMLVAFSEAVARRGLASMSDSLGKHPLGFGQWLVALDGALATPVEVAIVGEPSAEDTRALLDVVLGSYRPHQLVAAGSETCRRS